MSLNSFRTPNHGFSLPISFFHQSLVRCFLTVERKVRKKIFLFRHKMKSVSIISCLLLSAAGEIDLSNSSTRSTTKVSPKNSSGRRITVSVPSTSKTTKNYVDNEGKVVYKVKKITETTEYIAPPSTAAKDSNPCKPCPEHKPRCECKSVCQTCVHGQPCDCRQQEMPRMQVQQQSNDQARYPQNLITPNRASMQQNNNYITPSMAPMYPQGFNNVNPQYPMGPWVGSPSGSQQFYNGKNLPQASTTPKPGVFSKLASIFRGNAKGTAQQQYKPRTQVAQQPQQFTNACSQECIQDSCYPCQNIVSKIICTSWSECQQVVSL